jgi:hypothetical protein
MRARALPSILPGAARLCREKYQWRDRFHAWIPCRGRGSYPIMDSMLSPQMPHKNGRSRPATSGFRRITFDVPTEDAARFKAVCALNQTSMAAEIQILIAAEIAEPERLLSQRLRLAGAPRSAAT